MFYPSQAHKRFLLALTLLVASVAGACDSGGPNSEESVAGTWKGDWKFGSTPRVPENDWTVVFGEDKSVKVYLTHTPTAQTEYASGTYDYDSATSTIVFDYLWASGSHGQATGTVNLDLMTIKGDWKNLANPSESGLFVLGTGPIYALEAQNARTSSIVPCRPATCRTAASVETRS